MRLLTAASAAAAAALTGCTPAQPSPPPTSGAAAQLLQQLTADHGPLHPSGRSGTVTTIDPWPAWQRCSDTAAPSQVAPTLTATTRVLHDDPAAEHTRLRRRLQDRGYHQPPYGPTGWGDAPTTRPAAWAASGPGRRLAVLDRRGPTITLTLAAPCPTPPGRLPGPAPAARAERTSKAAAARDELARIMAALQLQDRHITQPAPQQPASPGDGPLPDDTAGRDGWYAAPCGTGWALAAQIRAQPPGRDPDHEPLLTALADKTRRSAQASTYNQPDHDTSTRNGDDGTKTVGWHLTSINTSGTRWRIDAGNTGPDLDGDHPTQRVYTIRISTC